MFDRSQMKQAAQARLATGGRWMAVLVCLIVAAIGGGVSVSTPFDLDTVTEEVVSTPSFGSEALFGDSLSTILGFLSALIAVILAAGLVYTALVSNVATVGMRGWFLRYSRGEMPRVPDVFLGFRIYGKVVLTMLLRDVFVFLWSLLFLIPGIIKGCSYHLVPYLIYENPKLTPKQALALSQTMMDGWKWDVFLLELSFLGWRLLSLLTFGVLEVLYVNPYYETAMAMFYDTVRYDALYVRRVISHADLDEECPYTTATTTNMATESPDVLSTEPTMIPPTEGPLHGITEDLSIHRPDNPAE